MTSGVIILLRSFAYHQSAGLFHFEVGNSYTHDRQCMCNVKLRHVRVTIVVIEKQCVTYSDCMFVKHYRYRPNWPRGWIEV
jgi:hypothetical protein